MKTLYDNMMTAEVEADVYAGDNCDEVTKHFSTYCKDDMAADTHTDDIIISLKDLPPGARILVQYPCCPDCGIARPDTFKSHGYEGLEIIGHDSKCECGFDWDEWVLNEYS